MIRIGLKEKIELFKLTESQLNHLKLTSMWGMCKYNHNRGRTEPRQLPVCKWPVDHRRWRSSHESWAVRGVQVWMHRRLHASLEIRPICWSGRPGSGFTVIINWTEKLSLTWLKISFRGFQLCSSSAGWNFQSPLALSLAYRSSCSSLRFDLCNFQFFSSFIVLCGDSVDVE